MLRVSVGWRVRSSVRLGELGQGEVEMDVGAGARATARCCTAQVT